MQAWNVVGSIHGFVLPDSVYRESIGRNYNDTKELVLRVMGSDFQFEKFHHECSEWMWSFIESNGVPQKPGVHELLNVLKKQNIPVALGTSSSEKSTRLILERAGLAKYFDAFAFGSECSRGKPYPDIFQLALHRLQEKNSAQLDTASCFVFEDSPAGLRASDAAGMRSIFVPDIAVSPPEVLSRVWRQCPSLIDAISLLKAECVID